MRVHPPLMIRGLFLACWLPIAGAVNSINRCMGQPDLYPFVLTEAVIQKLGFVHDLVRPPDPPAGAAAGQKSGKAQEP